MITFYVAIITAILYARWISNNIEWPIWMRAFIGLVWGLIVVYSVII